jgi:predicted nucleic acid-binding protein
VRVYADTSWWLACKCRQDQHHPLAIKLFDREPDAEVFWTPWHRVEVFNAFRQAERGGLVGRGEALQLIRLLEQEVRLGYWPHVEFDWTDAVRTACEIGAEHSLHLLVRAMYLFHVAIARETAADAFLSFDGDQNSLAKAAGLPLLTLTPKRKR